MGKNLPVYLTAGPGIVGQKIVGVQSGKENQRRQRRLQQEQVNIQREALQAQREGVNRAETELRRQSNLSREFLTSSFNRSARELEPFRQLQLSALNSLNPASAEAGRINESALRGSRAGLNRAGVVTPDREREFRERTARNLNLDRRRAFVGSRTGQDLAGLNLQLGLALAQNQAGLGNQLGSVIAGSGANAANILQSSGSNITSLGLQGILSRAQGQQAFNNALDTSALSLLSLFGGGK